MNMVGVPMLPHSPGKIGTFQDNTNDYD